ncbi:MAG: GDP-mannose 4,6-dehydratase [Planctomycetes bacterium]|nr:GDP-mannose 4,6-dehydratase [Planctomycetota bacterium]
MASAAKKSAPAWRWQDRPVFVTGATGFLGSWLVRDLVDRGADVVALVRDDVPGSELRRSGTLERISQVHGALEDFDCLERAINEFEIETVFHVGAQTIVGIANRNPRSTFEANVKGTWNLLEACRRVPTVKRIVIASSDKAYGDSDELPYDESTPLRGRHPYDVSKSCADLIATAYHATYGSPVAITRCGNLYGGGDLNWNRIIPGTIRSVIRGERPVIRSDGSYVRDYFFVKDAVLAYVALAEKMDDRALHGEAFNFSNETQLSVLDVAREVLTVMKSKLELDVRNEASGEIKHQYLSAKKARQRLGWKPRFTLRDALGETVEWYREYFRSRGA